MTGEEKAQGWIWHGWREMTAGEKYSAGPSGRRAAAPAYSMLSMRVTVALLRSGQFKCPPRTTPREWDPHYLKFLTLSSIFLPAFFVDVEHIQFPKTLVWSFLRLDFFHKSLWQKFSHELRFKIFYSDFVLIFFTTSFVPTFKIFFIFYKIYKLFFIFLQNFIHKCFVELLFINSFQTFSKHFPFSRKFVHKLFFE
jgi:hypothetical protein